jgi:hypothetical protein
VARSSEAVGLCEENVDASSAIAVAMRTTTPASCLRSRSGNRRHRSYHTPTTRALIGMADSATKLDGQRHGYRGRMSNRCESSLPAVWDLWEGWPPMPPVSIGSRRTAASPWHLGRGRVNRPGSEPSFMLLPNALNEMPISAASGTAHIQMFQGPSLTQRCR